MQSVHVKDIATYICTSSNRTERAANLAIQMKLYVNIRRIMPYNKDGEYSYMWTRAQIIIWCEHIGGLTY